MLNYKHKLTNQRKLNMHIEVGQIWKTRDGRTAKVVENRVGDPYPFTVVANTGERYSVTTEGCESVFNERALDLRTRINFEAAPWYPDDSGEWIEVPDTQMYEPVLPVGSLVKVLLRGEREKHQVPDEFGDTPAMWSWENDPKTHGRIVAYRVVGVQTLESTLPSAPDLLDKAASHMRERAATYDSPGGERSMAKTVALFNLHHDTALTEAQGWHFMQILKDVRLFSAKGYHADSAEDGIAYKALMSEAKAKEGAQ